MKNPKEGKLIEGTDGIRKLRYAPPRLNVGKRGATRVLYVHFEECGIVILALVYGKGEMDDISPAAKQQLRTLIKEIEGELRRRKSLMGQQKQTRRK